MSLTWAIIVEPDTNVSDSEIPHILFYLKHISAVKIPGNVSASEILMPHTWAIIFEPDTNVSGGVTNQISFHLKHISGVEIPGNVSASEILMSLTWAIIVAPDTNVSEGVINQISFHLKHISAVKTPGNFSVSEILMSLTWAIILEPDTNVSVIHQKPFHLKHRSGVKIQGSNIVSIENPSSGLNKILVFDLFHKFDVIKRRQYSERFPGTRSITPSLSAPTASILLGHEHLTWERIPVKAGGHNLRIVLWPCEVIAHTSIPSTAKSGRSGRVPERTVNVILLLVYTSWWTPFVSFDVLQFAYREFHKRVIYLKRAITHIDIVPHISFIIVDVLT